MNQSTPETPSLAEAFHALCKARGLPVVSGTVNNFSAGVTAITFSADAIRGPDVDAVIDLAAPKMGVIELSTESGRLITRAWMLGGPMALCWDDSDDAGGDGDDEADEDARLAKLGRELASVAAFQRAWTKVSRIRVAVEWLGSEAAMDEDVVLQVANNASVVWEHELLPAKVVSYIEIGSTVSEISAALDIPLSKAKRLVEKVRNA